LFTRPDAEIRTEILDDVLLRTLWIDPREMDVSVADGVVRMRGTVEARSVAELVERVVRVTDGVVDVVNELGYERDDTGDKPSPGPLHGVFGHRRPPGV
ncbi:BON domain-containing protein, partial [Catenulispora subtropica]|uniref:BON domain-containing protein n=1 Tax=Catenulispora subtropica TaxID=450798 RepID=UPI0031D7E977